jgi:release factor glutamine methyltransferase
MNSLFLNFWKERNSRPGYYGKATVAGITVNVHKGVYSPDPKCTHATTLLTKILTDFTGKKVLDLGTGCGFLAIYAVRHGATKCTAVDIQPEAVENARENVADFRLNEVIDVFESDLFDAVKGKYDVVLANLPIMDPEWTDLNQFANSVNQRFFNELDSKLAPGGKAYISSTSWGDLPELKRMIAESGFQFKVYSDELPDAIWYVFELTRSADL